MPHKASEVKETVTSADGDRVWSLSQRKRKGKGEDKEP
jgi:hypothetical protein